MSRRVKHVAATLLSLLLSTTALAPSVRSQGAPSPDSTERSAQSWHVEVAPYLWFPGISGTVGADGQQASIHVTAGDVLSNFNFGLMGAVEARYHRVIIPIDFMWVKLTDNKGISDVEGVESVHAKLNEDIFTPKIGFRVIENNKFTADALVGIRFWHVGTTLTLEPTQPNNKFYGGPNWVDGVEGARFQVVLGRNAELTIAGDAGGGGAKLDYQVVGLVGYKLKKMTLQGGWRYLVIHKSPEGGSFVNLAMSGVILGAVISIK
jgi:hypothetical protein